MVSRDDQFLAWGPACQMGMALVAIGALLFFFCVLGWARGDGLERDLVLMVASFAGSGAVVLGAGVRRIGLDRGRAKILVFHHLLAGRARAIDVADVVDLCLAYPMTFGHFTRARRPLSLELVLRNGAVVVAGQFYRRARAERVLERLREFVRGPELS